MQRKYYEAYDDRYRQIHSQNLKWFDESPSAIVLETIHGFGITKENKLLELGCGEGRDAFPLLQAGFRLLATDISPEAIRFAGKNTRNTKKTSPFWIVWQENAANSLTSSTQ